MAKHGITAKLSINGKTKGFKDLSVDMSGNEVEISSRGEDYKRYLRGQRNFSIESSAEIGSEGAAEILTAYNSGEAVSVAMHGASSQYGTGGILVSGEMIVLNASPDYPVDGEAVIQFKLGLDAASDEDPTVNPGNA